MSLFFTVFARGRRRIRDARNKMKREMCIARLSRQISCDEEKGDRDRDRDREGRRLSGKAFHLMIRETIEKPYPLAYARGHLWPRKQNVR